MPTYRWKIKQATDRGYILCDLWGGAEMSYPTSKTRRGRVQRHGQISPTLQTEGDIRVMGYRIRKLTPRECWRLMSFSEMKDGKIIDTAFEKAEKTNSNTQLYKQAGNSICKCCLEELFKNLF